MKKRMLCMVGACMLLGTTLASCSNNEVDLNDAESRNLRLASGINLFGVNSANKVNKAFNAFHHLHSQFFQVILHLGLDFLKLQFQIGNFSFNSTQINFFFLLKGIHIARNIKVKVIFFNLVKAG